MEFWSAEQLQEEFKVEASFYQLKIGKEFYQCRNLARILRKGSDKQEHGDAVVIMANPGSCCPSDPSYQPPIVDADFNSLDFVDVKIDPTQRQLMRLMKTMNWNKISIINLSDLCSGNMRDFKEKLRKAEQNGCKHHSIFAETRAFERELLLSKESKIILAWGKDPCIKHLACEALKKRPEEQLVYGLLYQTPNWGFQHPFPMIQNKCIKWLGNMVSQLKNSNGITVASITENINCK